jgi:hypothetical protein
VLRQHLGLIDVIGSAVESGDPTGFTSALREHLDRTHRQ